MGRSYMAKRMCGVVWCMLYVCAEVRCSMCNRQSESVKTNAATVSGGPKKKSDWGKIRVTDSERGYSGGRGCCERAAPTK